MIDKEFMRLTIPPDLGNCKNLIPELHCLFSIFDEEGEGYLIFSYEEEINLDKNVFKLGVMEFTITKILDSLVAESDNTPEIEWQIMEKPTNLRDAIISLLSKQGLEILNEKEETDLNIVGICLEIPEEEACCIAKSVFNFLEIEDSSNEAN